MLREKERSLWVMKENDELAKENRSLRVANDLVNLNESFSVSTPVCPSAPAMENSQSQGAGTNLFDLLGDWGMFGQAIVPPPSYKSATAAGTVQSSDHFVQESMQDALAPAPLDNAGSQNPPFVNRLLDILQESMRNQGVQAAPVQTKPVSISLKDLPTFDGTSSSALIKFLCNFDRCRTFRALGSSDVPKLAAELSHGLCEGSF